MMSHKSVRCAYNVVISARDVRTVEWRACRTAGKHTRVKSKHVYSQPDCCYD